MICLNLKSLRYVSVFTLQQPEYAVQIGRNNIRSFDLSFCTGDKDHCVSSRYLRGKISQLSIFQLGKPSTRYLDAYASRHRYEK